MLFRSGAQELDGPGEDDDEAVPGVDGLGDDPGEIGGLPALDVPDDQALGLVGPASGRVGEPSDDLRGGRVDRGDGVGIEPALQDLAVTVPVEVVRPTTVLVVPGRPLRVDDDGRPVEGRGERPVDAGRGAVLIEIGRASCRERV